MEYTYGPSVIMWTPLLWILTVPVAIAQVQLGQRGCVPCTAATPAETPSVVLWYRGRHETSRELLIVGQSDGRQVKMADRQGLQVDVWTQGLTVRGVRKEDRKNFMCVFVPLSTVHHSYMGAAPFSQHAEFPCTARTNVTDIKLVMWYRGLVTMTTIDGDLLYVIDDARKVHVTSDVRFDMEVTMTSYSLKVGVVLPSDVGFTCVVVSADGLSTSHAKAQPAGNPGTPLDLGVRDVTSRTATLTWQYNGDGGFPPLSAEVDTILHDRDASWEQAQYEGESCDVIKRQCHVTVTGLTPRSQYRFRLCAKNSHEDGARYSDYVEDHEVTATARLPAVSLLPVRVYPGLLSLTWTLGTPPPPRRRPSRRRYRRDTPVPGPVGHQYGRDTPVLPPVRHQYRTLTLGPNLSVVLEYEIPNSNVYSRYPREGKVALEERGLNITGDFSPYNDYNVVLKVYEHPTNHPSLLLTAAYMGGINNTTDNNNNGNNNNGNNNGNNNNNKGNHNNGKNNNGNSNNGNSNNSNSTNNGNYNNNTNNINITTGPVPEVQLYPVTVQEGTLTVRWTSNCSQPCAQSYFHLHPLGVVIEYEIPHTDVYSRYPVSGLLPVDKEVVHIKGDFTPSTDYTVHLLLYQHLHTHPALTLTTNYTGLLTMSVTDTEGLQMPMPLIIMSTLGGVILILLISLIITCVKKR